MRSKLHRLVSAAFLCTTVLSLAVIGCQPPPPPPPPDYAAAYSPLVDTYVNVWNTGDVAALDGIVTEDFVRYGAPNTSAEGRDSVKAVITAFRTTYPDLNVTVDEAVYTADRVTVRWSITGTNTGPGEIPATGRAISLSGLSLVHVADSMMTQEWVSADNAAIMQQLGYTFTPPPAPRRQ